jgi:hypothetical protein
MSSNNRLIAAAAALVTTVVFAGAANATLVRSITFDDKVSSAQSVILGHCTETRTTWDPEHRWILTYATFAVDDTLKGAPVREVTVVTPGGSLDGVHQSSIGITPFQKGDERVLFVKNTRVGPTVAFFDQGAYSVSKDAKGERIILPVSAESVRVDSQTGKVVPAEQPRTLRQFIGELRASERRIEAVSAGAMVRQREAQHVQAPVSIFRRYWLLFALAGVGAAFATWQILRK